MYLFHIFLIKITLVTMYLLLLMCICVVLNFYYESISQYRGTKMADGANEKQLKS